MRRVLTIRVDVTDCTRADYSTEPELPRELVHVLWSEPALATPEQVSALAAEVLRWRGMLEPADPDVDAALLREED